MTPTIEENQSEPKFYEIDGVKYFVDENRDMFRLDFDTTDLQEDSTTLPSETVKHPGAFRAYCKSKGMTSEDGKVTDECIEAGLKSDDETIQARAKLARAFKTMRGQKKDFILTFDMLESLTEDFEQVYKSILSMPPEIKKKKNMTKEDELSRDLTKKQYRENYWHETKETKTDGSTAMMETRISKCVEAGGSHEECSKQVKAEMKAKGSENTNTEDMTEDATEEKAEKVEVCSKEYDFLKQKYEEFKKLETEKKQLETDFTKWGNIIKQIQEEREAEQAQKREEKIKKLSTDFQLPEDELKEDSIKPLLEDPSHDKILDFIESILDKAGKRAVDKDLDSEISKDFTTYLSNAQEEHTKLMAKLRHS